MAQLPSQSQFGDYGEWPGRDVLDSGGERLGGVREIYLDRETGRPEWVLVDVAGDEARFVPLADASVESSRIRVAHSAEAIRSAPGIGSEPRIDQSEERRLYDHYGLGYSESDSGSGLPADEPPTREHEQPANGPTPTAWGSETREDTTPDEATTHAFGADEPKPEPWTPAEDATPAPPPWRADTADEPAAYAAPDEPASSWSAAADEPSNLAPPPAEPPSVEELEAAEIPEPPGSEEDFAATSELEPDASSLPSAGGEILATPSPETEDLKAAHGPDTVRTFTPPPPPRAQQPPPPPEPEAGGPLEVVAARKKGIAVGVGIAAVLFFVIRRLR
jgi:hypothetical protein